MNRRHARGAATMEFALASIMIVPCLIYGVYAGELFVVGAKAQEAEISAAYDVTAYRFHDYDNATASRVPAKVSDQYDTVGRSVSAAIQADLKDLNSYGPDRGTGVTLVAGTAKFVGATAVVCKKQPLSNGAGLGGAYLRQVDVMPFDSVDFPADPNFTRTADPAAKNLRDTLNREWILTCQSKIEHTAVWVPRRWNQEMTSHDDALNPITAPQQFGGLGSSLNGLKSGTQPSQGMAMLTDDWAVDKPNGAGAAEVALRESDSANPQMYRTSDRVMRMFWPPLAEEQINEDFTFLLGHRFVFGETTSTGKASALRLALDSTYGRKSDLNIENPGDPADGNIPWSLLPQRDGERSLSPLETVAGSRARSNYMGHPSASFNKP